MPRIIPEPKYFSMPSIEVGADMRMKRALNCWPWVRSLTHSPDAVIHSPAEMVAAWPMTVTRSRCPRAFARRTQKPFSSLWKVTRSTRPARISWVDGSGCGFICVGAFGAVPPASGTSPTRASALRGVLAPHRRRSPGSIPHWTLPRAASGRGRLFSDVRPMRPKQDRRSNFATQKKVSWHARISPALALRWARPRPPARLDHVLIEPE
jgi:hypothetical protein